MLLVAKGYWTMIAIPDLGNETRLPEESHHATATGARWS